MITKFQDKRRGPTYNLVVGPDLEIKKCFTIRDNGNRKMPKKSRMVMTFLYYVAKRGAKDEIEKEETPYG